MTVFYGLRAFIDALKLRRIRITEVMETVCNDPEIRASTLDLISEPGSMSGPLPSWLRETFKDAGMTEAEIDHVEHWPDDQKEIARAEIASAYEREQSIHFGWDLGEGSRGFTAVNQDDEGEAVLVFLSPRQALEVTDDGQSVFDDLSPGSSV